MMNDAILLRLKGPAIGLIVAGSLNGIVALLTLVSGLFRFSGIIGRETLPAADAERMGFIFGTAIGYGIALLTLIAAPAF